MSEQTVDRRPNLFGYFGRFEGDCRVVGWVGDQTQPVAPKIEVFVTRNGVEIGRVVANVPRGDEHRGFCVETLPITKEELLRDQVTVWAEADGAPPFVLPFYSVLREQIFGEFMADIAGLIKTDDRRRVALAALHDPAAGPILLATVPEGWAATEQEISPVGLRVGTVSHDDGTIVGHDGRLFLYRGNNNIYACYGFDPASDMVINAAKGWLALMHRRETEINAAGAEFLQLIIPDKNSVLPDLFPLPIVTPTPLLRAIEGGDPPASYLSGWRALTQAPQRLDTFLRTDSHLGDRGSALLLQVMLEHLAQRSTALAAAAAPGIDILRRDDLFQARRVTTGDLTFRLFGTYLYESVATASPWFASAHESSLSLVSETTPTRGHNGIRRRWINPRAPVKLKVVAFANSFFERGDGPMGLSWWCKMIFSDFEFIWEDETDIDYVRKVRPDLVICQTVERFLLRVPKS